MTHNTVPPARRENPATRARSRATSYVTAPPSPVDADDPLLELALPAFSAFGSESAPVR